MKSLLIITLKSNILILKVILLMLWLILLMLQISRVSTVPLLLLVPIFKRVSFTKQKKKTKKTNLSYLYHNTSCIQHTPKKNIIFILFPN
jgi:Ca2+/Na+ antiporter